MEDVIDDGLDQGSLVLVIINNMKLIGRLYEEDNLITLEEAVSVIEVMTDKGMAIVSTIIGEAIFFKNESIICKLTNKSPYFQNYFQTTSNISIPSDNIKPFRPN